MNWNLHKSNEFPPSTTGELGDDVRVVMEQARHYGMLVVGAKEKARSHCLPPMSQRNICLFLVLCSCSDALLCESQNRSTMQSA